MENADTHSSNKVDFQEDGSQVVKISLLARKIDSGKSDIN